MAQYAQAIQQNYPELRIEGANYPPPAYRQYLAGFLSIFKFVVIGCIVSGKNIFSQLNMDTPNAWTWALENKIYACMMVFFISNAVEGQLMSTGAFEITFNDVPIWSKLQSGRVPAGQELFQIIWSTTDLLRKPTLGKPNS
uniref:Thioredoxin reductase-like selenoprotein T n=1 Tax=Branchiostoma floridae TaxID=7739 RepID=C3YK24_BRAFL|eukprot:XP_002603470.1 hypothetical protein BRAFLDRAFT_80438 [Branchiostoma floridae]